jgi:hypothetical protein
MLCIVDYKKNNIILKIVFSLLQILTFFKFYSGFFSGENVDDFFSLVLMIFELITLLNCIDLIEKVFFVIDYCLLSSVLIIRLNILNGFVQFKAQNSVGVILVIVSLIAHTYVIAKKTDNKNQQYKPEAVRAISEVEIEEYVYNKMMKMLRVHDEQESDENIRKYMWIVFCAFIAIVMFAGKFVIDIKNMFLTEYEFDIVCIIVYLVLNVIFVIVNYIKSCMNGCNKIIDLFEVVLFLIATNLFVFAQREYARFQILVVVAYLCAPYVMYTRSLMNQVQTQQA